MFSWMNRKHNAIFILKQSIPLGPFLLNGGFAQMPLSKESGAVPIARRIAERRKYADKQ